MSEKEKNKLNMDTVKLKENLKKMELKRDEYVFDVKGYNQKRNVKRVLIGKHAYTLNKLFEDDEEEEESEEEKKGKGRVVRRSSSLILQSKYEDHNIEQFRRLFFDYKKQKVRHKRRKPKRAKEANLDPNIRVTNVLQQKILDEDIAKGVMDAEPEPIIPTAPPEIQRKEDIKALRDIRNEMKKLTQPGFTGKKSKKEKKVKDKSKGKKTKTESKKMPTSRPRSRKDKFIIKKIMDRKSTFIKEKKPFLTLIDEDNKIEMTEGVIDLIEKLYDPELRAGSIDTMSIHSDSLRDLFGKKKETKKRKPQKKGKTIKVKDDFEIPKIDEFKIEDERIHMSSEETVSHAEEISVVEKESSTLFQPIPSSELGLRRESSELFVPVKPPKRKPTEKGEDEEEISSEISIKDHEKQTKTKTFDLRRGRKYRYAEFFKYSIYGIPKRHPSGFSFSGFCFHCQNFQPCAKMPCLELKRSLPDFEERSRRWCCKKWMEGNIPIPHPSGMTFSDFRFKY